MGYFKESIIDETENLNLVENEISSTEINIDQLFFQGFEVEKASTEEIIRTQAS